MQDYGTLARSPRHKAWVRAVFINSLLVIAPQKV